MEKLNENMQFYYFSRPQSTRKAKNIHNKNINS